MQTELTKLIVALTDLYAADAFLFDKDAGEQALTHRLAVHLERQFPGWAVDCNYDRLGERTLHLPHGAIVSTDDHLARSIYPDIVVHQREVPNNLLAVELRKVLNHTSLEHDRKKLITLTDPDIWFAWWIGVLLVLDRHKVTLAEVYVGGRLDDALSRWFTAQLAECGPGTAG